jgi:hypothetical protein
LELEGVQFSVTHDEPELNGFARQSAEIVVPFPGDRFLDEITFDDISIRDGVPFNRFAIPPEKLYRDRTGNARFDIEHKPFPREYERDSHEFAT